MVKMGNYGCVAQWALIAQHATRRSRDAVCLARGTPPLPVYWLYNGGCMVHTMHSTTIYGTYSTTCNTFVVVATNEKDDFERKKYPLSQLVV